MRHFLLAAFILLGINLTAQKIYIPYHAAGKWGLADTNGKVVLAPQYDTLEYEEFYNYTNKGICFITVKNKRRGVVLNSKPVLPPSYDRVYINRYFFFCTNGKETDKNISLHNLQGQLLNQKPYKDADQLYHNYNNYEQTMFAVKLAENNYDLIYIDTTGKLVTLLKNQYSINRDNNIVEVVKKAGADKDRYTVVRSAKGILSLQIQKPLADNETGIMYDEAKPVMEMSDGRPQSYRFIKNGNEWKSYSNYNANTIDFQWSQYDSLYLLNTDYSNIYTKKENGQYLQYENVLVTRKRGLYGLVFPDGSRILNGYTSIELFRIGPANNFLKHIEHPMFRVKMDGKYGIIGIDDKAIIPIIYDMVTSDLIVKQGNAYGVLQTDGSWQLSLQYDLIVFERSKQQYELTKNGKYGLYIFNNDKSQSILVDCKAPFPLKGWKRFRTNAPTYLPYIVYEAYNNGKFLGYYDRKGFMYFSK